MRVGEEGNCKYLSAYMNAIILTLGVCVALRLSCADRFVKAYLYKGMIWLTQYIFSCSISPAPSPPLKIFFLIASVLLLSFINSLI